MEMQFLNFINIDNSNDGNDDFDSLFEFIEYISEFDDGIKKARTFTTNCITMGIQETKTIKQRMSFNISEENNKFIKFFNQHFPEQKIYKAFLSDFYKTLKKNVKDFPIIQNKNPKKETLLEHLNNNIDHYLNQYLIAINLFKD